MPKDEETPSKIDKKLEEICSDVERSHKRQIERTCQNKDTFVEFMFTAQTESNLAPSSKQNYIYALYRLSKFRNNKPFKEMTRDDIVQFLNSLRKRATHTWIETYNNYLVLLKRFFRWLYYPDLEQKERIEKPVPPCIHNINKLRNKTKSKYKPSDMWSAEDNLLFLKYCPLKRERCYHAMESELSCRPSEILRLRIKDIVHKTREGRQYFEVVVNGKTGDRPLLLLDSLPYIIDWLSAHPQKNNPDAHLICNIGKKPGNKINHTDSLYAAFMRMKEYFKKLLDNPTVSEEDKLKIEDLLAKPWNTYVFRHSSLTELSRKGLNEFKLRQHGGWTENSKMPQKYTHFNGNEANEAIFELHGFKPIGEQVSNPISKLCPHCNEPYMIGEKFCQNPKCRLVLSKEAHDEMIKEKEFNDARMKAVEESLRVLSELVKDPKKLKQIAEEV